MLFFSRITKSKYKAFLMVLGIQVFKEFIDSFALTASWPEALSDTAVTMLYPSVVLIIHRIKSDHS